MKMKMLSIIMILSFFNTGFGTGSKRTMLCHKWREVGMKTFSENYKDVDKSMAEIIRFKPDGTYDKDLYGSLHFKGQWLFSNDSSRIALRITVINGRVLPGNDSFNNEHATDSIIKLTQDTLIIGQLKYFGPGKIYGHDDVYYLRED